MDARPIIELTQTRGAMMASVYRNASRRSGLLHRRLTYQRLEDKRLLSVVGHPGGLDGKVVFVSARHGWYADNLGDGSWHTQRSEAPDTEVVEDFGNQDHMDLPHRARFLKDGEGAGDGYERPAHAGVSRNRLRDGIRPERNPRTLPTTCLAIGRLSHGDFLYGSGSFGSGRAKAPTWQSSAVSSRKVRAVPWPHEPHRGIGGPVPAIG
jgi:hypothetical protein